MKSRKHSKLKRHPLVRFIRGIFRLFRIIFKPKKSLRRSDRYHQEFTEESLQLDLATEVDRYPDNLITVGELFSTVKWQLPEPIILEPLPEPITTIQSYDVSRN
jgi:hypothetical protein